jgi:two-component system sensor histidine kinase DegS
MAEESGSVLAELRDIATESQAEYEQIQRELNELTVLLRQTIAESEKMVQRNNQVMKKLREMEISIDTYSRADIKSIYATTQESQMRLFMLREQVEQLKAKRTNLERYAQHLTRLLGVIGQLPPEIAEGTAAGGGVTLLDAPPQQAIIKIIQAQEDERFRVSRQMHDGPAQALTNLVLQAEICERLFSRDPELARTELSNLKKMVNKVFQQTKGFIFELRPMILDDLGLLPTVRRYIQTFQETSGIHVDFQVMGRERRLPPHVEVALFRIIQESLTNASKGGHATNVKVNLNLEGDVLSVVVEDDGVGFRVEEALTKAHERRTLGLAMILERAEMLGGKIEWDSQLGKGAKMTMEIPVRAGTA